MTLRATLAVACALTCGCRSSTYLISSPAQEPPVHESRIFVFWGYVQNTTLDGNAACPSGVAAIRETRGVVDATLNALTLGIYSPRTLDIYCRGGTLDIEQLATFDQLPYNAEEIPLRPSAGQIVWQIVLWPLFIGQFRSRFSELQPANLERSETQNADRTRYGIFWGRGVDPYSGTGSVLAPIGGGDVDATRLCGEPERVIRIETNTVYFAPYMQAVSVLCDSNWDDYEGLDDREESQ